MGIDMLFLSKEEITQLLSLEKIVEIIDGVFKAHGEGKVLCPPKLMLDLRKDKIDGWINSMPAYLKYLNICGVKLVNVHGQNGKYDLPVTMGTITLFEPATAKPLAIMDGMWITHMRTGAATAVAAKYLARKNSSTVTIIGAGAQGRSNLEALNIVLDIDEVRVTDINPEASKKYSIEMSEKLNLEITEFDNVEDASKGADVIIVATTSKHPVLMEKWIGPGTLVVDLTAFIDIDRELLYKSNKYIVDEEACVLKRVKEITGTEVSRDRVYGELGEIAAGKKPGRENDDEIILFTPVGMGSEDVAVAYYAYINALKAKTGKTLTLVKNF